MDRRTIGVVILIVFSLCGMISSSSEAGELANQIKKQASEAKELEDLMRDFNDVIEMGDLKSAKTLSLKISHYLKFSAVLTEVSKKVGTLEDEETKRQAEWESLKAKLESSQSELETLRTQISTQSTQMDDCQSELSEAEYRLKETQTKLGNSQYSIGDCQSKLNSLQLKYSSCQSDLARSRADLEECESAQTVNPQQTSTAGNGL